MAVEKKLRDILACPACKGELAYNASPEGFSCAACRLRYPVKGGVPMLIADAAEKLE